MAGDARANSLTAGNSWLRLLTRPDGMFVVVNKMSVVGVVGDVNDKLTHCGRSP